MIPKARYASTLADSISTSSSTVTATSKNNLEGNSGAGANEAIGVNDFIRLLTPDPDNAGTYIAEVMQVTAVSTVGTTLVMTVDRTDSGFTGSPAEVSGTWAYNSGTGTVDITATPATNYAFAAGSTIENINTNALLRNTSAGATLDDYYLQFATGNIMFVNTGATGSNNFKVNTGMTVSVFGSYKSDSAKQINLGKKQATMEWTAELEHQMPDDRWFKARFHRCTATPETVDFQFQPTDWVGSELRLDVLFSSNPAHAENPLCYIRIDNDPITLAPVTVRQDTLTAGVYKLYLTPNNTALALSRGLPVTRYDVGNVRLGGMQSPQQYLEHLAGIPQTLDKKILVRKQMTLTTTIEEVTAENVALLFDGNVVDVASGFLPFNTVVEISEAPDAPLTLADVVYPLGYMVLNPA